MKRINEILKRLLRKSVLKRIVVIPIAATSLSLLIVLGIGWDLSKSEWAAWVQAIGSITAIFVALWVVQIQHAKEVSLKKEVERQNHRRQLSTLKWIYNSVAETCSSSANKVGHDNIRWDLESEILAERRKLLLSVPFDQHPNPGLLIRTQELGHLLQLAITVSNALQQPRSEKIRSHVNEMLKVALIDALTGVTEATHLLVKCSTQSELQSDWALLDARKENRALTIKVLEEIGIKPKTQVSPKSPERHV